MKLKALIDKILGGESVDALERAELETLDPDAMARQIEELRSANAALEGEKAASRRAGQVAEIALAGGCCDPAYLDYKLEQSKVDLDDAAAVGEFMKEFSAASPGCFRARIVPGSSAGTAAPAERSQESGCGFQSDRIGRIAAEIDAAPDAL